jgi:hypothetical protein
MLADLVRLLVDEIRVAPRSWDSLSEEAQDVALRRIKERLSAAVAVSVGHLAAASRHVLVATVDAVAFRDGIKATLVVPRECKERHHLADAVGQQVLVILGQSMESYSRGLDEIRAEADQRALNLAERFEDSTSQAALGQMEPGGPEAGSPSAGPSGIAREEDAPTEPLTREQPRKVQVRCIKEVITEEDGGLEITVFLPEEEYSATWFAGSLSARGINGKWYTLKKSGRDDDAGWFAEHFVEIAG